MIYIVRSGRVYITISHRQRALLALALPPVCRQLSEITTLCSILASLLKSSSAVGNAPYRGKKIRLWLNRITQEKFTFGNSVESSREWEQGRREAQRPTTIADLPVLQHLQHHLLHTYFRGAISFPSLEWNVPCVIYGIHPGRSKRLLALLEKFYYIV